MWPNPKETAHLLKKSLMENFIFCAVILLNFKKSQNIMTMIAWNFFHSLCIFGWIYGAYFSRVKIIINTAFDLS